MNTVLSTRVDEQHRQHPPSAHAGERGNVRANRVGPLDRVALHLGLALITWSRRPRKAASRATSREYNAYEQREREAARRERDEQWERAILVAHPWR
jgi:hypothetical protein